MKFLSNIYFFAKRELFKITKDINLIMIFLVAPLTYPAIYGSVYMNKVEQKVPIAVCDQDNSQESRELVRSINAMQNINIVCNAGSDIEIDQLLCDSKIQGGLIIPKDFSKKLKIGETAYLNLKMNPGRLIVLSDIGIPISQAGNEFGVQISREILQNRGVPALKSKEFFAPVRLTYNTMFNPFVSYGEMMLPALMAIILSQLTFVGTAGAQSVEHLSGWKDICKGKKYPFTNFSIGIGKLIAITSIFAIFTIALGLTIVPLFQVHLAGNMWETYFIAMMGVMASAAFGLFIGTFFKHKVTTFVVIGFTSYPFFMASGYAWPTGQLPIALKYIAQAFPSTSFLQALFKTTQMELPLSYAQDNLITLGALTVIYIILFQARLWYLNRKILRDEPEDTLEVKTAI